MTKKELIDALEKFDDDSVVILGDSKTGWSNIEKIILDGSSVAILPEEYPVFSDN